MNVEYCRILITKGWETTIHKCTSQPCGAACAYILFFIFFPWLGCCIRSVVVIVSSRVHFSFCAIFFRIFFLSFSLYTHYSRTWILFCLVPFWKMIFVRRRSVTLWKWLHFRKTKKNHSISFVWTQSCFCLVYRCVCAVCVCVRVAWWARYVACLCCIRTEYTYIYILMALLAVCDVGPDSLSLSHILRESFVYIPLMFSILFSLFFICFNA